MYKILKYSEYAWNSVREFSFSNRTIVEFGFLLIYTLEQILLVYFISKTDPITIVSYFAILILSTFSIHKIFMESRMKIMESEINRLKTDKERLEVENNVLNVKYEIAFKQKKKT